MNTAPAARVPIIVPPRGVIPRPRPRPPFATAVFIPRPGFGSGFGGDCFFNGFTTFCRPRFCPWLGFWNLGFGPGWGYGLGYGYGYGLGYGWGGSSIYSAPYADDGSPQNSGRMDIYGGYIGDAPPNADAATPNPDENPPVPAQIILKDGSAYAVKSYWVSNGELYYRPVTGGLNHVPLEQLDLAATVEANSRNGVPFVLSDHPPQN